VLNAAIAGKKKYIMKTTGVDDASRASAATVLPRRTLSQTYNHVARLSISKSTPWILQQYIKGEEYCTHAVVIDGKVKLFVACPSSDLLMHYQAMPPEFGLNQAMLHFTEEFARRAGPNFTGHLSFDFMVEETITEGSVQKKIYPIECNPRAHTAVVLFSGIKGSSDMVNAYMSVLDSSAVNGVSGNFELPLPDLDAGSVAFPRPTTPGYYWVGHDLVTLVLHPLLRLLTFRIGMWQFIHHVTTFVNHVLFWKDGTYEIWDPLPWWWLYHVYWPGQFWVCLRTGRRWSRMNVSTTKVFAC
jgi:catechol O-methyltransferase